VAKLARNLSSNTSEVRKEAATPAALGYRMPAEWEPHAATWMAWPHYRGDWPGKFEPVPWVYAEITRNLAQYERVELVVADAGAERQARKLLERADALSTNVCFHRWPTNRVWMRDSGCIFVKRGADSVVRERRAAAQECSPQLALSLSKGREPWVRAGDDRAPTGRKNPSSNSLAPHANVDALKFRFNAWAKYSNWRHDEKIGKLMANAAGSHELRPLWGGTRVVLEGGSIDVNGHGTVLTTEECLLSKIQQRNPGMSRADYEKVFADYLGAPHVIWLGRGIFGDDTHGHVDDLTRFVSADTVVTMVEPNPKDVNHKPLRDNLRRLQAARDQDGQPLNVVEIPMPQPVVFEERRLPASYANFYIANGVVLAPVFNRPNDRIALNTLAQLFPARSVVPIYSGDFIWGLGAMHCMTQQQPARTV
jgi:agmatine deiminase